MKDYVTTPFDDLKISTTTTLVYSNVIFKPRPIFQEIEVIHHGVPLSKKEKKAVTSSYGSIVGMQHDIYFRGVRMATSKKYWCPICQIYSDKGKKLLTIEEEESELSTEESLLFPSGTRKLRFKCTKCKKYHDRKNLGKIVVFLNQITIVVALEKTTVQAMFFDTKCKLSGTKKFTDAAEVIMLLWEEYIQPDPKFWSYTNIDNAIINDKVQFCFEPIMINVGFKLGFPIDKCNLNMILNESQYADKVYLSQHEPTSATHVNSKMHTGKPENYTYDVLTYDNGSNIGAYFIDSPVKLYASTIEKKKKTVITFITFSSSEIILSGRYREDMRLIYEFFVNTAYSRKDDVMEKIKVDIPSLCEFRKQVGW